ncbi:hypothetical protein P7C73_g142, partial [Tremellales sp. Uapishka_1]
MSLTAPSTTLYVANLETKTKKPELRAQLYALFTPYGRIIDIIAKKHGGGRGQAFVVFSDQVAATAAMRGLSGSAFYSKDLRITYAKRPSNATLAQTDPSLTRDAAAVKAAKLVVSNAQGEYEQMEKEREMEEGGLKRGLEEADGGGGSGERDAKRQKAGADDDDMEMEIEVEDEDEEDGVKVVANNLPSEATTEILGALFGQYTGFIKASLLPSSATLPPSLPPSNEGALAYNVFFKTNENAQTAVSSLQGYLMQPGWQMGVCLV